MTTKYITTYIAAGYTLSPVYNTLSITTTGGVGGTGILAPQNATIVNDGRVKGQSALYFPPTIYFKQGGTLINGSPSVLSAYVYGWVKGVDVVQNFATMDSRISVYRSLTNGSASDHAALIEGEIDGGAATISNYATISGRVELGGSGIVMNGADSDTTAIIQGSVLTGESTVTVENYGTIISASSGHYQTGVVLNYEFGVDKGILVNGSNQDQAALIAGSASGVLMREGDTATNFGTITGGGAGAGIDAEAGVIVNGSGTNDAAIITGATGISQSGDEGGISVTNFSIISGGDKTGDCGVQLENYSGVTNGSTTDRSALIEGYVGLSGYFYCDIANFGTIAGLGSSGGAGILITGGRGGQGSTIINYGVIDGGGGAAVDFEHSSNTLVVEDGSVFEGAVIGGGGVLDLANGVGELAGLPGAGAITVSDDQSPVTTFDAFGTLQIGSAADFTLSGRGFIAAGQRVVDDGILNLGVGRHSTIVNAGEIEADAGTLTISGRVHNRGRIESNQAGTLVMSRQVKNRGTLSVGVGGLLTLLRRLYNNGIIAADGGTMVVSRAVGGDGAATINGGVLDLVSRFTQNVTFTGTTGELELGRSQTYTGTVGGFSLVGHTSLDLRDIGFVNADEATFLNGVLTVSDGVHTANLHLSGNFNNEIFIASSDHHGGVKIVAQAAARSAKPLAFIEAMAHLRSPSGPVVWTGSPSAARMPNLVSPRPAMA